MKPATFFLALTLILLFTKPSLSSRAIVDDTVVYDSSGNPLEKGASYFISPPGWGAFGGPVMLGSPNENNETCEADVLQSPFDLDPGTPFTFTPVDNEDVIKLGYPVAIQSPTENPCKYGSTVWKLSSRNEVPAEIITTGGIINTPSSCLRITRRNEPVILPLVGTYTLEYCPFMCGAGFKICKPIGIYMNNYQRHLSPNAEWPFRFILIKASESAVMSAVV